MRIRRLLPLAAIVTVAVLARLALERWVEHRGAAALRRLGQKIGPQLRLDHGEIDLHLLRRLVTVRDVQVRPARDDRGIAIAEVVLRDIDRAQVARPRWLDVELVGVRLVGDATSGDVYRSDLALLADLGYAQTTANVRLRYAMDAEILAVEELSIHAAEALDLRLEARLGPLDEKRLRQGDLGGAQLETLRVDGDERGFLRRLSAHLRQSEPELTAMIIGGLFDVATAARADERRLFTALHAFLLKPGRLHLSVATSAPVQLEELAREHKISGLLTRFAVRLDGEEAQGRLEDRHGGSAALGPILDYRPESVTRVYAGDGAVLGQIGRERRFPLSVAQLPPRLVQGFLAAEDSAFHEHEGVDPTAIFRAVLRNLSAQGLVQGGSAITQQLIKQMVVGQERSLGRKLAEAVLALRLEQLRSKEEILYVYLNEIYLGGGAYGVEAAAQTYFGKSAAELDLAESALIAGLPRAPSVSNPFRSRDGAEARRRYVLARMLDLA